MDIKRIVQENEMHKNKNTWAFEPGDHIVIQIKIDGSNASVRYDPETGKLAAFSRKQQIVRQRMSTRHQNFSTMWIHWTRRSFRSIPIMYFLGNG